MFKVTIEKIFTAPDKAPERVEVFSQSVENLDLNAVIKAINSLK